MLPRREYTMRCCTFFWFFFRKHSNSPKHLAALIAPYSEQLIGIPSAESELIGESDCWSIEFKRLSRANTRGLSLGQLAGRQAAFPLPSIGKRGGMTV